MALYIVVLLGCSWLVRHDGAQHFFLYFWSALPALPILAVVWRMARYLSEETDEYQRLLVMQSLLVGTAALVCTLMVNDFLRQFAKFSALPPFLEFVVFFLGIVATQAIQRLRNRAGIDD